MGYRSSTLSGFLKLKINVNLRRQVGLLCLLLAYLGYLIGIPVVLSICH